MSIIAATQNAFITRLEEVREASDDTSYPKQIKPYGAELKNPRNVNHLPSIYVDLSSDGLLESDDQLGELHTGTYAVELVLFDQNKASKKAANGTLAELIDWTISALKGQVLVISGIPVVVAKNIKWRSVTDYVVPFAIVRVTLTIQEDVE